MRVFKNRLKEIVHYRSTGRDNKIGPLLLHTGCFKANVYTLTGDCDKYTKYTEKVVVELLSVHLEISFDNNKSEKIT